MDYRQGSPGGLCDSAGGLTEGEQEVGGKNGPNTGSLSSLLRVPGPSLPHLPPSLSVRPSELFLFVRFYLHAPFLLSCPSPFP